MGFSHAYGQIAIAHSFEFCQSFFSIVAKVNAVSTINFTSNGFDFLFQRHIVFVDGFEVSSTTFNQSNYFFSKFNTAFATTSEYIGQSYVYTVFSAVFTYSFQFFRSILCKNIDGNYQRYAKFLNVFNVFFKVYDTFFNCFHVGSSQFRFRNTTMHLESTNSCNQYNSVRFQACITAFNIKEFFCTKVSTKTCFSNGVVCQFHSSFSCHYTVAAVSNVCKGTTVDNCRNIFQSLNEVRFNSIFQESCHCSVRIDLTSSNCFACIVISNDNLAKAFFQIAKTGCQAEDCHNFGSNSNVEAILARYTVSFATQTNNDVTEFAVVHINNTFPNDTARVNIQSVALLHVVIYHCGKKHVSRSNSMEVTGKVQVNIFHRNYLGVTAASSATFNAHTRTKGRFTQCYNNVLVNFSQTLCQANSSSGFAFACRSRSDCSNKNQFTRFFSFHSANQIHGQFRFIATIHFNVFFGDTKFCSHFSNF